LKLKTEKKGYISTRIQQCWQKPGECSMKSVEGNPGQLVSTDLALNQQVRKAGEMPLADAMPLSPNTKYSV